MGRRSRAVGILSDRARKHLFPDALFTRRNGGSSVTCIGHLPIDRIPMTAYSGCRTYVGSGIDHALRRIYRGPDRSHQPDLQACVPDKHEKHLALLNALKEVQEYRRERDDALLAIEQLQQQLADSQALSRVGTWRRTVGTNDMHWSDQTYRIHGLQPGSPLDREKAVGLVHENDRGRVRAVFDEAIRLGQSFRIIYRINRPDGQVRILHADNMVLVDESGGKSVIYGAVHDITEAPLPASPMAVEMEAIPNNSLVFDHAGIIMRHSGTFTPRVRNLESGTSVFRLFKADESHERLGELLDLLESDGHPRQIALSFDGDEQEENCLFEIRTWVPYGDKLGFVMTALDGERQHQSASPELSVLEDPLPLSGAWERNMETNDILWSRAMYDIVERDVAEPPLTRAAFADLVHEDDLAEFRTLSETLDRTKLPIDHQFRIRVPSGVTKTVRIHAEYLNRTHANSHIMGTLTDVSHTTDLQQAIRAADLKEQRLRRALDVHRQELLMASLRLQTAQEKERLRIATELHDEAGGLLTAISLTLNELRTTAPEDTMERISGLVDQLADQIRSTSRELRPSVLEKFGLMDGLEQMAQDMATLGGWQLELDLPTADDILESETSDALFGIAREALLNTLKHADAGHLRLRLLRRTDGILLEVVDDGIGLPENMQPNVSTGLGLATMRDRAQALGGFLQLDRSASGGTRVTAFLPATP